MQTESMSDTNHKRLSTNAASRAAAYDAKIASVNSIRVYIAPLSFTEKENLIKTQENREMVKEKVTLEKIVLCLNDLTKDEIGEANIYKYISEATMTKFNKWLIAFSDEFDCKKLDGKSSTIGGFKVSIENGENEEIHYRRAIFKFYQLPLKYPASLIKEFLLEKGIDDSHISSINDELIEPIRGRSDFKIKQGIRATLKIPDGEYNADLVNSLVGETQIFGEPVNIILIGDEKRCFFCKSSDHLQRNCGLRKLYCTKCHQNGHDESKCGISWAEKLKQAAISNRKTSYSDVKRLGGNKPSNTKMKPHQHQQQQHHQQLEQNNNNNNRNNNRSDDSVFRVPSFRQQESNRTNAPLTSKNYPSGNAAFLDETSPNDSSGSEMVTDSSTRSSKRSKKERKEYKSILMRGPTDKTFTEIREYGTGTGICYVVTYDPRGRKISKHPVSKLDYMRDEVFLPFLLLPTEKQENHVMVNKENTYLTPLEVKACIKELASKRTE
jgi:hypothetical protein